MDQAELRKVAQQLPPLRTAGNRIVNAQTGHAILLRGINRSGFEYNSCADIPEAELDHIASWGANIVRLPFNQDWALGSEAYREALDRVIAMAAARGMYTLLDLQWLDAVTPRGTLKNGRTNFVPPLPDLHSVELWRLLAARYREIPAVLYDIFNEPHDPLPDDPLRLAGIRRIGRRIWHAWAARLVAAIRGENARALIFISGLDWGYDLSSFPLNGIENVVYSSHVYPHKKKTWEQAFGKPSRTHPVFIGEWGGTGADLLWGRQLVDYFDRLELGWTAWSWCDHPHLVKSGEPTAFGKLVRARLLLESVS
ncbi:MAG TPA: cellulase family glycosylhydrolase [Bryobacteraceae bacterium]|jgi:aryl-phospho-beta-D-glucosidase BglC (GH1 family)